MRKSGRRFFPKKIMRHLKEGSARCRAPLMADQLRDLLGMSPSRNCHEGGHPWLGRTRGMQLGYRDRLSCCDWLVDAVALTPADVRAQRPSRPTLWPQQAI